MSSAKLLDQLFALGLMPRYAFPTDVATFAVFEGASLSAKVVSSGQGGGGRLTSVQ